VYGEWQIIDSYGEESYDCASAQALPQLSPTKQPSSVSTSESATTASATTDFTVSMPAAEE